MLKDCQSLPSLYYKKVVDLDHETRLLNLKHITNILLRMLTILLQSTKGLFPHPDIVTLELLQVSSPLRGTIATVQHQRCLCVHLCHKLFARESKESTGNVSLHTEDENYQYLIFSSRSKSKPQRNY